MSTRRRDSGKKPGRHSRRRLPPEITPAAGDASYYELDPAHTDPARIRAERAQAREIKKSAWWHRQLQAGRCHYCGERFAPSELTMDHVVPLARGGRSTQGNLVPACLPCNAKKKLVTPAEELLSRLASRTDESDES